MVQYDHQKLDMWTNTGTLHYMAPEMWKGGYNELIDIWAVGVMCYEMVIGRMPFDHLYQKEVIKKIMEE
jgi:serine/threonine protein kinase